MTYEDWYFESADAEEFHYDNYDDWSLIFNTSFADNVLPKQITLNQYCNNANCGIVNNQLLLHITQTDKAPGAYLNISSVYTANHPLLLRIKAYRSPRTGSTHSRSAVQLKGVDHSMLRESYRGWPSSHWQGGAYCLYITDNSFMIGYNNGSWAHCSADVTMSNVWNNEWFTWTIWWIPYEFDDSLSVRKGISCMEREKIDDPSSKSSVCGIVGPMAYADRFDNKQIIFMQQGWWTNHKFIIDDIELYQIDGFFSDSQSTDEPEDTFSCDTGDRCDCESQFEDYSLCINYMFSSNAMSLDNRYMDLGNLNQREANICDCNCNGKDTIVIAGVVTLIAVIVCLLGIIGYLLRRNKYKRHYDGIEMGDEDNQDNIGIKLDENKLKWIENHVDGIDKIMTKYANSHKEMKSQLKSWEYKSFWKCENCGFINERLMIGGLWRLYHLYDSCGLCGDKRDEALNSKTSLTTEPREVQWHKFADDSQPKLTRQTSAFRRAMIPIEDEDDADKTVVAEEKTDDLVHTSQYKYPIYGTGIAMRYHELEPLYANLKDSLIASKFLDADLFARALNKAKKKEQDCVFDVYGRACMTDKRYGIEIDERMHIEHVLSFVLYCDYTLLCYKFMRSYIASNVDDSNETITQRHVETFYWLGRFIRSAIEFWGETIRKDTRLFMGMSTPLLFDQFAGTIEIPTSTTQNLQVAVKFFCR
eukprot:636196_1